MQSLKCLRKKIAIASIEKVLAGPSAADYLVQYFYNLMVISSKARTYIDKALELNADKPFTIYV
jgi:hypothetical protein